MIKAIENYKTLANLPPEEIEYLLGALKKVRVNAGDLLLKPGDDGTRLFALETGLLKTYFINQEGEVILKNFVKSGEIAVDYPGFLTKAPASIFIEALTESVVYVRPSNLSADLYKRHNAWLLVDMEILQSFVLRLSQRETDFLTMHASEKYLKTAADYVDLLHLIPQKDLASYLGITPESLSRIVRTTRKSSL